MAGAKVPRVEVPTLVLTVAMYALWALALFALPHLTLWLAVPLAALTIAQHSSLSHEAIHGHPFRSDLANEALVFPALDLFIPYRRFRDLHLAHHHDSVLTDPYDDPESNYLDAGVWEVLPRWKQVILRFNNRLAGRMLMGPFIAQWAFMKSDLAQWRAGRREVLGHWLLHLVSLAPVLALVVVSPMPLWAYLIAAWAGLGILKIRTFLEHQAHEKARARTVIVEDRGPLALLFLNNNLHVVHHMHPRVPWYRLPRLYHAHPERYLGVNEHYRYRSYAEVFRRYFFAAKDPVPHPLWRR